MHINGDRFMLIARVDLHILAYRNPSVGRFKDELRRGWRTETPKALIVTTWGFGLVFSSVFYSISAMKSTKCLRWGGEGGGLPGTRGCSVHFGASPLGSEEQREEPSTAPPPQRMQLLLLLWGGWGLCSPRERERIELRGGAMQHKVELMGGGGGGGGVRGVADPNHHH